MTSDGKHLKLAMQSLVNALTNAKLLENSSADVERVNQYLEHVDAPHGTLAKGTEPTSQDEIEKSVKTRGHA